MGSLIHTVGVVLAASLVFSSGRTLWRRIWTLEPTGKSWLALARAGFGLALAGLLFLFLGASAWNVLRGSLRLAELEDKPAPELRFVSVPAAAAGSLEDLRGQVVVVNFWATWCPPCIHEMPALRRLQTTYRDRGLVVLHISDESPGVLAGFLRRSPTPAVHGRVARFSWPAYARPTTFVVDREGIVRETLVGARSMEQFEAAVRDWL